MKKIVISLGLLAMASTLFCSNAWADRDPMNNPLILGDPCFNPNIPRPGPYTPKPKPGNSGTKGAVIMGNMVDISEGLTGNLRLVVENLDSGESFTVFVMPGDRLPAPEGGDWLLTLKQDGKTIDTQFISDL
ncbi:MAG: hypothetical protein IJ753_07310 [Bacteroidales bacterium]|nr:hypothetical protein [Bacteroidales bacterium]